MWAHWEGGWCFRSRDRNVKGKPNSRQLYTAVTSWNVTSRSSMQIGGLWAGNSEQKWILASLCWKQWWQHLNIAKFVAGVFHEYSNKNWKNTICKFFGMYCTNMRLKVIISWITSVLMMGCGVTAMNQIQKGSPWRSNAWVLHWRNSSRHSPHWVK